MRTFETEYQLKEWREIESQHFSSCGKAYRGQNMSSDVQEQLLRLINQLDSELTLIEGGWGNEKNILKQLDNMCEESLPPQEYESWEKINELLKNNRKYFK